MQNVREQYRDRRIGINIEGSEVIFRIAVYDPDNRILHEHGAEKDRIWKRVGIHFLRYQWCAWSILNAKNLKEMDVVLLMHHSNKMLSVLGKLGMAAYLPDGLTWPGCLRFKIVAEDFFSIVQHENVGSGDDNEDRERPSDFVEFDSGSGTCVGRILGRPILFETKGVMGDLLEIGQIKL